MKSLKGLLQTGMRKKSDENKEAKPVITNTKLNKSLGGKQLSSRQIESEMDGLYSLEDQIEMYADEYYDALVNSQRIFSSATHENDILKSMNSIGKTQMSIDHLLGEKVKENYPSLLRANEGIRSIDAEIHELRDLVKNTETLIQSIRETRSQTRSLQSSSQSSQSTNPNPPTSSSSLSSPAHDPSSSSSSSSSSSLAVWLFSAPSDIARLSIEKKYAAAVALTHACRAYVQSVLQLTSTRDSSSVETAAKAGLTAVEEKVPPLAEGILRSLAKLPVSSLLGNSSQYQLLRLLVSLGTDYYEQAVHGFAMMQEVVFRQTYGAADAHIRSSSMLSSEVDAYAAVQITSNMFFDSLLQSVTTFIRLFAESEASLEDNEEDNTNKSKTVSNISTPVALPIDVLRLLVKWVKTQLQTFSVKIFHQISSAAGDKTSLLLSQCDPSMQTGMVGGTAGPLVFSVHAITVAVSISTRADVIKADSSEAVRLECSSMLQWMLTNRVEECISSLADEIGREGASRIQDDKWMPLSPSSSSSSSSSSTGVSSSCEWIYRAINMFVSEVVAFRSAAGEAIRGDNAAAALIKIYAAVVRECELVNLDYLSEESRQCFRSSLLASSKLFPAAMDRVVPVIAGTEEGTATKSVSIRKIVDYLAGQLVRMIKKQN